MAVYGAGIYGLGIYGVGSVPSIEDWGPLPSSPNTSRWDRAAQQGGARALRALTVTVPGGAPVELVTTALTVTQDLDAASRFAATADVVRIPGQDTWRLITTPGARFEIHHGWDYGGGYQEMRPLGVYELAAAPKSTRSESVSISLLDLWKRLEECRLLAPVTAAVGAPRTSLVRLAVLDAIPDARFRITAEGGEVGSAVTWDRERTTMIQDLARDGGFVAYFDADGVFVMEPDPVIEGTNPIETFADGPDATILALSSEQVYTRLYNGVVVVPTDEQSWSPVTVWISNTDHPRHPSKIGYRPAFYSSPTLAAHSAVSAGASVLRRYINALTRIEISTGARGHRRPGETVSTYESASYTDAATDGLWLVEKVTHDLHTLETTIAARSAADVPTEEE